MLVMGLIVWGPDIAEAYDDVYAAMFEPSALSARGIAVTGIELSPDMAGRPLRGGADRAPAPRRSARRGATSGLLSWT